MYERVAYSEEWDNVRNAPGDDGKPAYADSPDYGSKEFRTAIRQAAAQIPGFGGMVFRDKNTGQVLPLPSSTSRYFRPLRILRVEASEHMLKKEYVRDGNRQIIGSVTTGYSGGTSAVVRDENNQIVGRTSELFHTTRDKDGGLVSINSSDPGLLINRKK